MRTSAIALMLFAACGSDPTGSSDATTTSTTDATTTSTSPTDVTSNTTTSTTDTTTTEDVHANFTLETGTVTIARPCGGATFEVPFHVTGLLPFGTPIEAELSNGNGVFNGNVVGSTDYAGTDGTITATIPGDVRYFPVYRVRVRAAGVAATDSGNAFELSSGPEENFSVYFPRTFGTVNGEYTAEADVGRAVSFVWQLGDGASPATSTDAAPTWSYTTSGHKTITLTAKDELGCERTEQVFSPIDVFGCDFVVPSDIDVLRGVGELGNNDGWICAGGDYEALGGRRLVVVEPAGRFEWRGGGQYGVVVRAGGTYIGEGSRDVVLYETGASLVGAVGELLECPTLNIDYDDAPDPGCVSDGPPTIATLSTLPGAACPNTEYPFAFTATGDPAADNQYLVQLSNEGGTFTNPEVIGSLASDALSGTVTGSIGDLDGTKSWAVRIIATNPSGVGPSLQLPVSVIAEAGFSVSNGTPFANEDVTVVDTTIGPHQNVQWDFGPGAVANVLVGNTATVHWTTGGDKVIKMTALDASGCPLEVRKTVKVVGCELTLPANTRVITDNAGFVTNSQVPILVCPGGRAQIVNGAQTMVVKAGGALEFFNGDGNTFYVEAGAAFDGHFADDGLLISEPGALIAHAADMPKRSCEALTIDTSLVSTQCGAVTPPALTIGDAPATVCPGATIEVPYTQVGLFAFDSTLTLQVSDASGSFTSPVATSTTKTATTFSITVPTTAPQGTAYRLRLVASNPNVIATSAAAFTVPTSTIPSFTLSATKVLVGTEVTFTPETPANNYTWTFPPGSGVNIPGIPGVFATTTNTGPLTVTFPTPGTKTVSVTIGTGECSQTTTHTLEVYSCNPTIPSDAIVATSNVSGEGGGQESVLVCEGVSYGGGGGAWTMYVEPGATGVFEGGGSWTWYVPNGATLNRMSGSNVLTIIKGPSATLTNILASAVVLTCPVDITFDTSALPTQCP